MCIYIYAYKCIYIYFSDMRDAVIAWCLCPGGERARKFFSHNRPRISSAEHSVAYSADTSVNKQRATCLDHLCIAGFAVAFQKQAQHENHSASRISGTFPGGR